MKSTSAQYLGSGSATEYVELEAMDIDQQLIVGVTANSMQPKDQIAEGNQAMTLGAGKLHRAENFT